MSDKKQLALKLLELGYAKNHIEDLKEQKKVKQAHEQVKLNEVELNNPILMLRKGYEVLEAINKPEQTTVNFASQPDEDGEIKQIKKQIADLQETAKKLEKL